MIGLRRGEVILCDHQKEWELYPEALIKTLRGMLGDTAVDIQHIGSTAIRHIKAKPLIDIAVAVHDFESLSPFFPALESGGVYNARNQPLPGIVLCAVKNRPGATCLWASCTLSWQAARSGTTTSISEIT